MQVILKYKRDRFWKYNSNQFFFFVHYYVSFIDGNVLIQTNLWNSGPLLICISFKHIQGVFFFKEHRICFLVPPLQFDIEHIEYFKTEYGGSCHKITPTSQFASTRGAFRPDAILQAHINVRFLPLHPFGTWVQRSNLDHFLKDIKLLAWDRTHDFWISSQGFKPLEFPLFSIFWMVKYPHVYFCINLNDITMTRNCSCCWTRTCQKPLTPSQISFIWNEGRKMLWR